MATTHTQCGVGGCERSPRVGRTFCDRCEGTRAAAQHAADTNDPTSLFGAPRASLPEHAALPIAGKAITSKRAAASVRDTYRSRKYLIHEHIKSCGAHGATRPEIADALGLKVNSVNSACNTLYRQGLTATNGGATRPDPISGLACAVLVDEQFVERWHGCPRRTRSTMYDEGDAHSVGARRECDLIHPATGEPMSENERDRLLAQRAVAESIPAGGGS